MLPVFNQRVKKVFPSLVMKKVASDVGDPCPAVLHQNNPF